MKTKWLLPLLALSGIVLSLYVCMRQRPIPDALRVEFNVALDRHFSEIDERRYAILIDYSMPLYQKRLWLVDIRNDEVLVNSHVAHASNSGWLYPTELSNVPNTEKSCIGAFLTGRSYTGRFGYAMRIHGLDLGINDKAFRRAIVFHQVRVPLYTEGCFGTSETINQQLIDYCKDGSIVYVRGPGEG